jgi:hypothetical protein
MKSSNLRAAVALACTLALSACGGSDGRFILGGSMSGITKTGLVLTNNGGSDYAVPVPSQGTGVGTFIFPDLLLDSDDTYNVEVKSKPANVETCQVFNGRGRVAFDVTTVSVVCTIKKHELKGTISNLKGSGLVIINGSDKQEIAAGTTSFTMTKVSEDAPYGVSILTQPAGQTCTVANGTGIMGSADVTNVAVTCTP